jgi:uncharacterized membrane protein YqiK
MEIMWTILSYWWLAVLILAAIFYKQTMRLFGIILIPEDKIGLVNKKFVFSTKTLPSGRIIATNGEPGYQAQTLSPGLHFFFWIWQYEVILQSFITVPAGKIGLISARDGNPVGQSQIVARSVECESFQNAVMFLNNNGCKGKQSEVLRAGTYRINTLLFEIMMQDVTVINEGTVGIVTTLDGIPIPVGDISGPVVVGHDNFQNMDAFLKSGGYRGLQQQVLLAGSWNLNPWALKVEGIALTEIPIGYVGVVNCYVGTDGVDTSGKEFEHGNIVSKGQKGVWNDTFGPGRYAINTKIMKVELVPTTNLVLNWADARTESHNLDKNLCTITVRSKDGFQFNLDVSQIIHVPAVDAPKVIARFGNMQNLVSQVLEPTIGNYFRNSAQDADAIAFLVTRKERQKSAKEHIESVLREYNVKAVDTLIGDIVPPPTLMETLTNRKLAEENKKTFEVQKMAEEQRQNLQKQKALADIQPNVVAAEQGVLIAERTADATVMKAKGDADGYKLKLEAEAAGKKMVAEAEAAAIRMIGDGEASKTLAVGKATAEAYQLQVTAMGSENFAKKIVVEAIAAGKIKVTPDVFVGGTTESGGSMGNALLAMIMADKTQTPKA